MDKNTWKIDDYQVNHLNDLSRSLTNGNTSLNKISRKNQTKDVHRKSTKSLKRKTPPLENEGGDWMARRVGKLKRKNKMGQPVVVSDAGKEYLRIPLTLRQTLANETLMENGSLEQISKRKRLDSAEKEVKVTRVESIKPKTCKNVREKILEAEPSAAKPEERQSCVNEVKVTESSSPVLPSEEAKVTETSSPVSGNDAQVPRFYSMRNKVLAIMEVGGRFSFNGKLRIRVLHGAVMVYGHRMVAGGNEGYVVYSPRGYSPVAIETVQALGIQCEISHLWHVLVKEATTGDDRLIKSLRKDVKNMQEGWAIVELENVDNRLTNFLAANCSYHLFPRIDDPSNLSWRDSRRAEVVLQANLRLEDATKRMTIDSRGLDKIADAICDEWETKKESRTIIAGGKAVGKSTMARYLVNKLLAKHDSVIFVDLDPGQAEFTPAGCLSVCIIDEPLLGPNFTHLKTPRYQLYVGVQGVTRFLEHYVDAVEKIIERLDTDTALSGCPVVVNTMGFCKDVGRDIMYYTVKIASPTDIVQILSRRSKNNFDAPLSRQVIDHQDLGWLSWKEAGGRRLLETKRTRHRLHAIESQAETGAGSTESWILEPHQKREIVMISYLSEMMKMDDSSPTNSLFQNRSLMHSLNTVTPYSIPFSSVCVSLTGAFVSHALSVMNGNIVVLCGVDLESSEQVESNENPTVLDYPRVLIRRPLSTCYGFGILRGIDMEKKKLFVNTPVPMAHTKHINCLIGGTGTPTSLLQPNEHGAPYTGSEYDLPTSREPRRGYFRMRYTGDATS